MIEASEALRRLGVPRLAGLATGPDWLDGSGPPLATGSPIDGSSVGTIATATASDVTSVIKNAQEAFAAWRAVPPPVRGEFVRRLGNEIRTAKEELASLVTWEVGKIPEESLGEVQEAIDICDFAVGLSRQLYGLTIASERPNHRMVEQWHPLGPVGVITAFNFPVAVWSWNAVLALVCGDSVIWKPSEKAPVCALACHALALRAARDMPEVPSGLLNVVIGTREAGQALAGDSRVPLVSATGSVTMGKAVERTVAGRLGRSLLELGGNNAMIVTPSADLELAQRAAVFSAVGTCGQRCTTLRRLILHRAVYEKFVSGLRGAYESLMIGDPREPGTLVGPLIDAAAADAMAEALAEARAEGAVVTGGGRVTGGVPAGGVYVRPALVEIEPTAPLLQREVFAPILYVMAYDDMNQAIRYQNGVPQGLASSMFTNDLREAELFTSGAGSDCGIVNVNIGTSGAEIGGAFGGEKDTGGGRESGSDAWKNYMRRATITVNYSGDLPLAQGIRFNEPTGPGDSDTP